MKTLSRAGALLFATVCASSASHAAPLDAQGQKVTNRVEQLLRAFITTKKGPLNLRLVPTERVGQGFFSDVQLSARNAKLKRIYVTEFSLRARNVQVDVPSLFNEGKIRTPRAQTQMRAVISENDLTKMLAEGKQTRGMGLKVKYTGDKMRITGNLNFPFLNGPVAGLAKLRRTSDNNVYLDILSLQLRGVEAPGFLKSQLEGRINPIINYSNLPFNPPFRKITVVGDKAILTT